MVISNTDIKLLWGRAAGFCSKPGCQHDLTRLVDGGKNYNVGEMAHVIAKSPSGPRSDGKKGADIYENLILLCPTCHRDVDKAPEGLFTDKLLHSWKEEHESRVRLLGSEEHFQSSQELSKAVRILLAENHSLWKTLGPNSEVAESDPSSNAHRLWELRRIDKIIPNNRRIMNVIRANQGLLNEAQANAFGEFANHAESFEEHVYERLDRYPLFPQSFPEAFKE